jgi:hypothetical protein
VDNNPPLADHYVESSTDGNEDLYGMESAVAGTELFLSVIAQMLCVGYIPFAPTTTAARLLAKSAGTEVDNGNDLMGPFTYNFLSARFDNDPATGLPWLEAAISAAQFGERMIAVNISPISRLDPLKGGISLGPVPTIIPDYVIAGTLGCICIDNTTSNHVVLTNWHVITALGAAAIGDDLLQPALLDYGIDPDDKIGVSLRAVGPNFTTHIGTVDAGIGSIDPTARGWLAEIMGIGAVAGTASAVLGSTVRKTGRTTATTVGTVDSIDLTVIVGYAGPFVTFDGQIGVTPTLIDNPFFTQPGDSGSVVVDADNKIIGLLFAGSFDGYAVLNPIADVLTALNISVAT